MADSDAGRRGLRAQLFTIGHSIRSIDDFMGLLLEARIRLLIDVRRWPASRRWPHVHGDALSASLAAAGIAYRHMPELGGRRRSGDVDALVGGAWRVAGFRGYAGHMRAPEFRAAVDELERIAGRERAAVMCSEALPWRCHRRLIADALVARGIVVCHLIGRERTQVHRLPPFARVDGTDVTYPGGPGERADDSRPEAGITTGAGGCATVSPVPPPSGERPAGCGRGGDVSAEERVAELGLDLSAPPAPVANYVRAVRVGDLLFLSGHGPRSINGSRVTGTLGIDMTVDEGYAAARSVGVQLLSTIRGELGTLDRVARVVKLLCMVRSAPQFGRHPEVANGCSDLLVDIFGEDGRHARSAVGMADLPGGIAVEIEAIVQVRDGGGSEGSAGR